MISEMTERTLQVFFTSQNLIEIPLSDNVQRSEYHSLNRCVFIPDAVSDQFTLVIPLSDINISTNVAI